MIDIGQHEIITEDNLNARVDLQVYFKVKAIEDGIKFCLYNVNNYKIQIINLGQTTARNVIGGLLFRDVNSKRNVLNQKIAEILVKETKSWGIDIIRVELKEILPPQDVQDTMNSVIKAENTKIAAKDYATAVETEADGKKRAKIKEAEGIAQGRVIVADATAKQIKVVNEAANKYFKGNAQKLKQLETFQESMKSNAKIILGSDSKNLLKLLDVGK
jgi:regulator of protease activity HflC (stomatin/prohibitin superfamily)